MEKKKKRKAVVQDGFSRFNRIKPATNVVFTLIFILLALITFLPVVFVFIISISSEASIAQNGYSFFPKELSLESYAYLWQSKDYIGRSFLNSIGITVVGTIIGLVLTGTLGYVLSRPNYYMRGIYTSSRCSSPAVWWPATWSTPRSITSRIPTGR